MARPRSEGPKRVVRRLSDGSKWAYYYDRRTGEKLSQECLDTKEPEVSPGTVAAMIDAYKASSLFKSKKPTTRKTYAGTLNYIRECMGDMAVTSITPERVQSIKDALQDEPSKANAVLTMLSIMLKREVRANRVPHNAAANPGKLPVAPRTQIWSYEAEDRYVAAFRLSLKLLFMLMLYTLQRLSDCLAMTKRQVIEREERKLEIVDGEVRDTARLRLYIVLEQSKTGALMAIPVHDRLEPLLRERMAQRITRQVKQPDGTTKEVECPYLVASPQGHQWLKRNASRAWDHDVALADKKLAAELTAAGLSPADIAERVGRQRQQRRDLRRTGIVRLAELGASTPQIAAISGHEIDYCQRIIDTYLPRRTEVALSGIELWESGASRAAAGRKILMVAGGAGIGK